MAAGRPLKSNDRGLLLQSMGNRKTRAPSLRDPSNRKQLHIRGGRPIELDLSQEAADARIRAITKPT